MDHVGPMARTVADAATLLEAMIDPSDGHPGNFKDLPDPQGFNPRGIKVGLVKGWWDACCDDEVGTACRAALKVLSGLGCEIDEIDFPFMPQLFAAARVAAICEAATYHEPWLKQQQDQYGSDVRNALLSGSIIPAKDYLHCLRVRSWGIKNIRSLFTKTDVLISPCNMEPAPKLEELKGAPKSLDIAFYTGPANFLGIPALSVPCGFASYGIPIGLQIMGPHFRDDRIIRLAQAYEAATQWHRRRPPLRT
jgi:aspartyl-tRNA(Asn)/glutamyl-tRNA(Gln) amidotransferase subunit A